MLEKKMNFCLLCKAVVKSICELNNLVLKTAFQYSKSCRITAKLIKSKCDPVVKTWSFHYLKLLIKAWKLNLKWLEFALKLGSLTRGHFLPYLNKKILALKVTQLLNEIEQKKILVAILTDGTWFRMYSQVSQHNSFKLDI